AAVLGRTLVLNNRTFTVVGVAAAPFEGVEFGSSTSVWIPVAMVRTFMTRSRDFAWFDQRRAGWLTFYGRLREGVRLSAAQAEVAAIAVRLAAKSPDSYQGRVMQLNE